jgi:hypothetical protein
LPREWTIVYWPTSIAGYWSVSHNLLEETDCMGEIGHLRPVKLAEDWLADGDWCNWQTIDGRMKCSDKSPEINQWRSPYVFCVMRNASLDLSCAWTQNYFHSGRAIRPVHPVMWYKVSRKSQVSHTAISPSLKGGWSGIDQASELSK